MKLYRITTSILATCALTALSAAPGMAQCSAGHVFASDVSPHSFLGSTVAVSGNAAIVGAEYDNGAGPDAGAAYFYEYEGDRFVEVAKVLPPTSDYGQHFGHAVAMDGDLAVVGGDDNQMAFAAGAGFLYRRTPQGWTPEDTLFASQPIHAEALGRSVAVEGDLVALGAPGFAPSTGRALVFEKGAAGWTEVAELTANAPFPTSHFGRRVLLSEGRIAVSAASSRGGIVFLYEEGPNGWEQTQMIQSTTRPRGIGLLDFEGGRLACSHGSDVREVLILDEVNGAWQTTGTLTGSGDPNITFGHSASLQGDRVLIGGDDQTVLFLAQEYVELFELENGVWSSKTRLEPQVGSNTHGFGEALALWNDTAIIGSPREYYQNDGFAGALHFVNLERRTRSLCDSTANSTGFPAELSLDCTNVPSEVALRAEPLPDTVGFFFYGTPTAPIPSFDGIRCVGGNLLRLPVTAVQNSSLTASIDLYDPSGLHELRPGTTWAVQAWFRDPAAGGQGSNFSSAFELELAP